MAPRGDRRQRGQRQSSWGQSWVATDSCTDVMGLNISPALASDEVVKIDAPSQSISILHEVFPDKKGNDEFCTTSLDKVQAPPLEQLLACLPTPSRAATSTACSSVLASSSLPSSQRQHLSLPSQVCQTAQDALDLSIFACAPAREPHVSYRERLRAGGRGAFQRAFEAGLVPKTMKREWNDGQTAFQLQLGSQGCTPMSSMSSPMSYTSAVGSQPVWNPGESRQGSEYWPVQMEQQHQLPIASSHQTQQNLPQYQEVHQTNRVVQQQPQMMAHVGGQQIQFQQPMQMMSQGQTGMDTSPPMTLNQSPQMQMHMPLASGDATPTEFHRCMAIIMADSALFSQDKNVVAAQLQAAADCQRYED